MSDEETRQSSAKIHVPDNNSNDGSDLLENESRERELEHYIIDDNDSENLGESNNAIENDPEISKSCEKKLSELIDQMLIGESTTDALTKWPIMILLADKKKVLLTEEILQECLLQKLAILLLRRSESINEVYTAAIARVELWKKKFDELKKRIVGIKQLLDKLPEIHDVVTID